MGLDYHALNFLGYSRSKKPMGRTVTVGRQGLHVATKTLQSLTGSDGSHEKGQYCEALLLDRFGATAVDSIDHSAYEGATIIHDMNDPVPEALTRQYDTVIDSGTLEHIFNIPQALNNCSRLCRPGGQIIHMLPANNFCGHGFWQFSPELFFSLYSTKNGYEETEVFLADLSDRKKWYKVVPPAGGRRVMIFSTTKVYVLVRTVLGHGEFSHAGIQQSDYVVKWADDGTAVPEKAAKPSGIRKRLASIAALRALSAPLRRRGLFARKSSGLSHRNPGLEVVDVASCVGSSESRSG